MSKGFTLMETLLSLSLLSILLLTALPVFRHLLESDTLDIEKIRLITAIKSTQQFAITMGQSTIFCASKSLTACDGDWTQGQIIMTKTQHILQTLAHLPGSLNLKWRSSLGINHYLQFDSKGFSAQQGSFLLCYQHRNGYRIIVTRSGRIKVEKLEEHLCA